MFHSLRSKLLLFFLILSLGGIILISVGVYFGFQESFQEYLQSNRDRQAEQVKNQIESEYISQNGMREMDQSFVMTLSHLGMNENIYFRIETRDGIMLDTTRTGGHMNHGMMHGRMGRGNHRGNDSFADFQESNLPLQNKLGETIGILTVLYPATFIDSEGEFFSQFSKYLIAASLFMIAVAILLSFVFSKRLTKGLDEVSKATKELKAHNFDTTIPMDHHVKEIDELAEGVNELALSLQKGEALRKQFTSDLAHELRTPLAILQSQIESFQDGVFEPTRERLDQCHLELMRLVRLVDEMEKLHVVENPHLSLNIQPLQVREQMNSLHMSFQSIFSEKGIEFLTRVEDDVAFYADPDRFVQMMTNILNNALKYTEKGGRVQFTGEDLGEEVCFTVQDSGKGMTQEELDHIFERFYRGEKSRNRKTGGLGIGLSIVKALVDAHKGRIDMASKKNQGTTVKIYLQKK